jgi:hypothetical protein
MEKLKEIKNENISQVFSYEVTMTVHVVADNKVEAERILNEKGGAVTKRKVVLLNAAVLYGEEVKK